MKYIIHTLRYCTISINKSVGSGCSFFPIPSVAVALVDALAVAVAVAVALVDALAVAVASTDDRKPPNPSPTSPEFAPNAAILC